ncbi:MAG: tRNA (guanosine(37)-N1)-methyltransferase TrmD [Treponema sp.]|nr:tRNA (guanosine(37)-N1)-methyltransferase TrmD [Treponema sp.]
MKYTVLSLFPQIIDAYFANSIMARAIKRGLVEYSPVNIRDYATDKHKTCDDSPYGGGPGMLMLAEPLARALEASGVKKKGAGTQEVFSVYLTPSGTPFNQKTARKLASKKELVLICGRYEGIDQRIIDLYVDEEISVGDYVLSSGEIAALVLIDATYRLIEQVITPESLTEESFNTGLLEYPQYTRPEIYDTLKVPDVLISGHHENIRRWRLEKQVEKTIGLRPDLIRQGLEMGLFDAETRGIIERQMNGHEE